MSRVQVATRGIDDVQAVRVLREMVEVPSLSGSEGALAEYLVLQMRQAGLNARIDEVGNAVGCTHGDPLVSVPGYQDIVLLGHMDVVPGHVELRQEGDLLYGRGSVDAKGPLAAFVVAASRAVLPPGMRVVVIGAVEEEIATSRGARAARERYSPAACIIGEPSGWDGVTIGYKGRVLVRFEMVRSMSHSAGPDRSVADEVSQWWWGVLEKVRAFGVAGSGVFDSIQTTLRSVVTSTDGLEERGCAVASLRLPPGVEPHQIREVCQTQVNGAVVRFEGEERAAVCDRTNAVVRALTGSIREAGCRPALIKKSGTSDMNVVAAPGWWMCPMAAYGPGDSQLDHTPNEHVSISEYLRAIQVLERAIPRCMG